MLEIIEFREGQDFEILTGDKERFFFDDMRSPDSSIMAATDYKNAEVKIVGVLPLQFQGTCEKGNEFSIETRDPDDNRIILMCPDRKKTLCGAFEFAPTKGTVAVVCPNRFFATENGYYGIIHRKGIGGVMRVPQIARYSAKFVNTMFTAGR